MSDRVLVIDDDEAFRKVTAALLAENGYEARVEPSGSAGLAAIEREAFDLVLTDLVMDGVNGLEVMRQVQVRTPGVPVVLITGYASIETAVQAMRDGAADYLQKPVHNQELLLRIERALARRRADEERERLRKELASQYRFDNILGASDSMRDVFRRIRQCAETDTTVLIRGETGTGKELVAHAIHYNSARRSGPFVTMNCAAVTETLLESELFGHEKGAFTGALQRRRGRFEAANAGTLFLDEVGDLPGPTQTKLLRVLEERSFERVGGSETIKVDIRVIAATHQNLEQLIRDGKFREDLFYRINVVPILLPPLRSRPEDIPLLADHFLRELSERHAKSLTGFSPDSVAAMLAHPWRGNVRELRNLIERAVVTSTGARIDDLEFAGASEGEDAARSGTAPTASPPAASTESRETPPGNDYGSFRSRVLDPLERDFLIRVLRDAGGKVGEAARLLGINRKTLYEKMKAHRIERTQRENGASS